MWNVCETWEISVFVRGKLLGTENFRCGAHGKLLCLGVNRIGSVCMSVRNFVSRSVRFLRSFSCVLMGKVRYMLMC